MLVRFHVAGPRRERRWKKGRWRKGEVPYSRGSPLQRASSRRTARTERVRLAFSPRIPRAVESPFGLDAAVSLVRRGREGREERRGTRGTDSGGFAVITAVSSSPGTFGRHSTGARVGDGCRPRKERDGTRRRNSCERGESSGDTEPLKNLAESREKASGRCRNWSLGDFCWHSCVRSRCIYWRGFSRRISPIHGGLTQRESRASFLIRYSSLYERSPRFISFLTCRSRARFRLASLLPVPRHHFRSPDPVAIRADWMGLATRDDRLRSARDRNGSTRSRADLRTSYRPRPRSVAHESAR